MLRRRGIGIEAGVWTPRRAGPGSLAESGIHVPARVLVEPRSENPYEAVRWPHEIDTALEAAGIRRAAAAPRRGPGDLGGARRGGPRGHDIRIGLEDVLTLPDMRRAPDNAALVVEAVLRYT